MTGSAAELWRRMRRLLLSAAVLALSMAASAIAGSWWLMTQPGASREVVVEVPQGRSLTATLHDLKAHGMVPSVTLARLYIAGWHDEPISHWGTYRFAPDTTPVEAIDRLLRGSVETVEITVPEGLVVEDVVALMVGDGIGTPDRWDRALAETELVHRCSEKATSLEGFLFPDTYRFAPGVTPRTVVHHMVERFWTVWEEERRSTSDPWGSCHDVVTLASMVEAETSSSGERPLIAGVFANRLQRSMLLQCDPTVIYALRRQGAWSGRLLRRHWSWMIRTTPTATPVSLPVLSTARAGPRSQPLSPQPAPSTCSLSPTRMGGTRSRAPCASTTVPWPVSVARAVDPLRDDDSVEDWRTRSMSEAYRGFGDFILFHEIYRHGLGTIYRAGEVARREKRLQRTVFLHVLDNPALDPDGVLACRETANQIGQVLRSSNTASNPVLGDVHGTPVLAFDYVPAVPLAAVLERARAEGFPVAVDNALLILEKLSTALSSALAVDVGSSSLVHGCLHPALVSITNEGEAVVAGFGIGGLAPAGARGSTGLSRRWSIRGARSDHVADRLEARRRLHSRLDLVRAAHWTAASS